MPSALGAWAVKSWVVLGLNFDTSTVDSELIWSIAHEKGGFKVVGDGETFFLGSFVTGETDFDGSWIGKLEWSADSAKGMNKSIENGNQFKNDCKWKIMVTKNDRKMTKIIFLKFPIFSNFRYFCNSCWI